MVRREIRKNIAGDLRYKARVSSSQSGGRDSSRTKIKRLKSGSVVRRQPVKS